MAKYEYLLTLWGGFFNKEHPHDFKAGNYWFDSIQERGDFISKLKKLERENNWRCLASDKHEGYKTRYKTIVTMVFVFNGEFKYRYDFGFCYPESAAKYMFFEGNYSCDCNRSGFLKEIHPNFPELECGDRIKIKDFRVFEEKIDNLKFYPST